MAVPVKLQFTILHKYLISRPEETAGIPAANWLGAVPGQRTRSKRIP